MGYISQHSSRAKDLTLAAGRGQPSIINEDLLVIGNVKSPGRLHIDGEVLGAVQCDSLLLGGRASLLGDVTAEEVIVNGTLTGSIRARRVTLCSDCKVEGEIFHEHLTIEQGAYFEGVSRRTDNPDEAKRS